MPKRRSRMNGMALRPTHGKPLRWLPRQGEPSCIVEWLSQRVVIALAYAPIYVAVVVTLTLLILIFGVPFMDER